MDYLLKVVSPAVEAKVVDGKEIKGRLATYELTQLQKAVDAEGKEVVVRTQKINMTKTQVENRIARLETELAKWNKIKADM
jgi:hypothetical protein